MVGFRTSISQLEKNMKKHNAIVYLVSCLFLELAVGLNPPPFLFTTQMGSRTYRKVLTFFKDWVLKKVVFLHPKKQSALKTSRWYKAIA